MGSFNSLKVNNFFYKKGIDITNAKSMFNFINEHFRYYTLNSWNGLMSIANNVKIYKLGLRGDYWEALKFLEAEQYYTVNQLIKIWEKENPNYRVGFNGRSGGYLVLYNNNDNRSIVPEALEGYSNYEDWKADLKNYGYRVKDFMDELVSTTKIIQSFDKLCDAIREYVNTFCSKDFGEESLKKAVEDFNIEYASIFGIKPLVVVDKKVDIEGIYSIKSLCEIFLHKCIEYSNNLFDIIIFTDKDKRTKIYLKNK